MAAVWRKIQARHVATCLLAVLLELWYGAPDRHAAILQPASVKESRSQDFLPVERVKQQGVVYYDRYDIIAALGPLLGSFRSLGARTLPMTDVYGSAVRVGLFGVRG